MTNSAELLKDLQGQLALLREDLTRRAADVPEFASALQEEYAAAVRARRTAETFETWRDDPVTQSAVAWVLGTVFVRFLEDNALIEPRISGLGDQRRFALDRHAAYFQQQPLHTDREYLLHVFGEVAALPAGREIFDARHNPLWRLTPSGDATKALVDFWQRIDPATGAIAHELADPSWDTRLLGDLYQDLSEGARKKYALLQTPRFVEAFILDRTLTPAIETFGYREATVIDPTCGSGHFLLGSFDRLLALYQAHEPGLNERDRVQRVLSQIAGVDVNPFAVAIARFRLLLAALRSCGITRLADAPRFQIEVATGDSLIHGRRFAEEGALQIPLDPDDPARHHFFAEDERVDRVLGRQYHAVVGNPPYITVKDRALNELYRSRYGSCHMKYALVVPFAERFFELALRGEEVRQAGFVGMIVANSFMKREFGKKLIEDYLNRVDLTHVIDTSGAYIPGHGTPTVILFGRNRKPSGPTRTVMGIRGEPSTPGNPAHGLVWTAILGQVDVVDSESAYVSVRDLEQELLHSHPWSIGGGGAAELKELLDDRGTCRLADMAESIGFASFTGSDDAFVADISAFRRRWVSAAVVRPFVSGDTVRDWQIATGEAALTPYDEALEALSWSVEEAWARWLWPCRTVIGNTLSFGGRTRFQSGEDWWTWYRWIKEKYRTPLSIVFAEVATHNHFVLDRGGKVFKQTAPVIKLPLDATEDDHYALLGLLNSSTACFWMKQVCFPKATATGDISLEKGRPEANRYAFSATALGEMPIPFERASPIAARVGRIASLAEQCTKALAGTEPSSMVSRLAESGELDTLAEALSDAAQQNGALKARLVALQEELDWEVYAAFALEAETSEERILDDGALGVRVEDRPFAIETPDQLRRLPNAIAEVYARRASRIASSSDLRLIETAVFKRPWLGRQGVYGHASLTFDERRLESLALQLLIRLEDGRYWPAPAQMTSAAKLADTARQDPEFMKVAEVFRGRPDFDVTLLVTELVTMEAVPYLPVLRYKAEGLRKRLQWERTWELQRREDEIDERVGLPEADPRRLTKEQAAAEKQARVGEIPVPPKYKSSDFRSGDYWRLRGKLDVPKERFILYPGAERAADSTPVVGWAGWDHLQQAHALSDYYVRMQEQEGWTAERLTPLLAGLLELVPWLKQWHNALDPQFNVRMGDYFAEFVETQARALGLTLDQVKGWTPAAPARRRRGAGGGRRRRGQPPDADTAEGEVDA